MDHVTAPSGAGRASALVAFVAAMLAAALPVAAQTMAEPLGSPVAPTLASSACPPSYSVVDLGVLRGATYSSATAINGSGQVIGVSGQRPFVWQSGRMLELVPTAGHSAAAEAINAFGDVVGTERPLNFSDPQDAVIWPRGATVPVQLPPLIPGSESAAHGVNDLRTIVGGAGGLADGAAVAWLPADPTAPVFTVRDFGIVGRATAINAAGDLVGIRHDAVGPGIDAFLRPAAGGVVFFARDAVPQAVNDAQQVVGTVRSVHHAFAWSPGTTLTDLGVFPSGSISDALAMNNLSQVVGSGDANDSSTAFVHCGGALHDLNGMLSSQGAGWQLFAATGINDVGQIVGNGAHNGLSRGFLLSPTTIAAVTPTTTSLSVSGANVGPVTLTAQVSPSAATGTVEFLDGATSLARVGVRAGQATLLTSFAHAGLHYLTASYSGDPNFASSTTTLTLGVIDPTASYALVTGNANGACEAMFGTWQPLSNTCLAQVQRVKLTSGNQLHIGPGVTLQTSLGLDNAGSIFAAGTIDLVHGTFADDGNLTIEAGGTVDVGGLLAVGATGWVNVSSGGDLEVPGAMEVLGALIDDGGMVDVLTGGGIELIGGEVMMLDGGTLVDNGLVDDHGGTLDVASGGHIEIQLGEIRVVDNGALNVDGGTVDVAGGGHIEIELGEMKVIDNGAINVDGGSLDLGPTVVLEADFGHMTIRNGGELEDGGTVDIGPAFTLTLDLANVRIRAGGAMENNGDITVSGGTILNDGTFTNNGVLIDGGTITDGGGTFTNTHALTISGGGRFNNASDGTIANTGGITIKSGGALDNSGALSNLGFLVVESGGRLTNAVGATYTGNPSIFAKANQTITFPGPGAARYGDAPVTLLATASSGLPVSYSVALGQPCSISGTTAVIHAAGACVITASQDGNALFLAAPPVHATLTIASAPLRITAQDQTMTYGGPMPTLTVAYSGLANGDSAPATPPTVSTVARSAGHVAGSPYPIVASGAADPNYMITYGPGALTVKPAALTITADNQTKPYGAALPTLTVGYTGLVNGDTPASLATAPTLATTATGSSHVSGNPYPITASGAVDPDYAISYVAGALTVTPVPLRITADSKTKVYGAPPPTLTATYGGFVNGDNPASLPTVPTLTTTATAASHVAGSPYPITASGAADPDYTISYVNGTLTVTQAVLTITADDRQKVLGAPVPALTFSYSGFVNGDAAANLTHTAVIATTATATTPPSGNPYPITLSGASSPDYSMTYVNGKLTVLYRFLGFISPSPFSTVGQDDEQRTLDVSFRLCDVNNVFFTAGSARLTIDGGAPKPAGTFNSGDSFKFISGDEDQRDGKQRASHGPLRCGAGEENRAAYVYRADISLLAPGNHLLTALIDDGTQEDVWITLHAHQIGEQRDTDRDTQYLSFGTLTPTPAAPALGQKLTVVGKGFAPGAQVRIDFGASYEVTVAAASDGSLTADVTPPLFDVAGTYRVVAVGPGPRGKLLALRGVVRYGLRPGEGGSDSNAAEDK